MEKTRKQIIDVLIRLNRQAAAEQHRQLQEVLQLERVLNRQLTTKKAVAREASQKKQTRQEEEVIKKQIALEKEVEQVIIESQTKLKQVSEAVNDQPKPKNYHYQPSNPPPPPRPPSKKESVPPPPQPPKRQSLAQQSRERLAQRNKEVLMEREEARAKKDNVTGKVTETVPPRFSKSVEKPKAVDQAPQPIKNEINANRPLRPPTQKKPAERQPDKQPIQVPKRLEETKQPATILQSFSNPKEALFFLKDQPSAARPKLKQYLEAYRKEELGYRQEESKARLSYLKQLGNYVPLKRSSNRHYTDAIEKRGWKGCDYVEVLEEALMKLDSQAIDEMTSNQKRKPLLVYQTFLRVQRIRDGYERLQQEKSKIRAPKVLNLHLQFVAQQKSTPISKKSQSSLSIDSYLLPVYELMLPVLGQMLQLRQLSKTDVKFLVELLNFLLSNSRKFFTVIESKQLKSFLDSISLEF